MAIISCRGVSFGYEGNIAAGNLDFQVNSGDYLCIVGENGSGKTTLVKGLLNLLSAISGQVEMSEGLCNTDIGYLPQQSAITKDFPASVYEVVLSGRLSTRGFRPFYSKKDKQITEENIRLLGIEPLQKVCYRELSGGQQQRVLLARALSAGKRVLLLDEPVSGLDPLFTQEFYKQLQRLNTEQGITIIMVSHDVKSAVTYASHILHLRTMQIFFGTAEEYIGTPIGMAYVGGGGIDRPNI